MKTQLTSRDIRCTVVKSPEKDYITEKIKQANNVTRTALCKCVHVDVYTR